MPTSIPTFRPAHQRTRQEADKERGSAHTRGYDARWRKVRSIKLRRDPLCEDCLLNGTVTVATEVHHIQKVADAPDQRLVLDNLMSLCKRCHSTRTAAGE